MPRRPRYHVRVSIDDSHLGQIDDVVKRLKHSGLDVTGVMPKLGTVTGSVEPTKMTAIRALKGVATVESAQEYQLPPSDAKIQ